MDTLESKNFIQDLMILLQADAPVELQNEEEIKAHELLEKLSSEHLSGEERSKLAQSLLIKPDKLKELATLLKGEDND